MAQLSLSGRVVRATDLQPLAGVCVRLHGPANVLAVIPGAQTLAQGQQIAWTRPLIGFAGTRWDCWTKFVQDRVTGLTWQQFADSALQHNPSLRGDHLFKADQTYLLPQNVPTPTWTWSRQLTGFAGSRWDCWTKFVQNQVRGITWQQFSDEALQYNPQLNETGRVFNAGRMYLIPESNTAARAYVAAITDANGAYSFTLGDRPVACELQVEVDDYARWVRPLVINGAINQPIALVPQATPQPGGNGAQQPGNLRSARLDYPALPPLARGVIDQALTMLGDDPVVFDALPPALQQMCYGARFANDPNHFNYKDLVCGDLVSIALKAAGCDIAWPSNANPHQADYYHPDRGNPKIVEIIDPNDWLPGDVLVYGSDAPTSRAGHVNLYVGPFNGIDRSGKQYTLSDGVDVVEASLNFMSSGRKIGTGVIGANLQRCLQSKRGVYTWVRHVRLRQLGAAFGRG